MTDIVERLRREGESAQSKHLSMGMWRLCAEAADEIERLRAAQRPLVAFARWAIQEGSWEGGALEGDYVQDRAEELGLIVKTKYDPKVHGESDIAEPGDDWYVFGPLIANRQAKP
jgi:hypothetical protein